MMPYSLNSQTEVSFYFFEFKDLFVFFMGTYLSY